VYHNFNIFNHIIVLVDCQFIFDILKLNFQCYVIEYLGLTVLQTFKCSVFAFRLHAFCLHFVCVSLAFRLHFVCVSFAFRLRFVCISFAFRLSGLKPFPVFVSKRLIFVFRFSFCVFRFGFCFLRLHLAFAFNVWVFVLF
jgi:hypothetical protein